MYKLYLRDVAEWVEKTYWEYLKAHANWPVAPNKPDWTMDGVLHASQVASCTKKVALINAGVIEDEADLWGLARMSAGESVGEVVARAVQWKLNKGPAVLDGCEVVSADIEYHVAQGGVVGNIDVLLHVTIKDGPIVRVVSVPVEVKLTNAWKYDGLTVGHFVQTSTYIKLLNATGRNVDGGVIFTLYDDRMAGVPSKWWIVGADSAAFTLYSEDGISAFTTADFKFYYTSNGTQLQMYKLDTMIANHQREALKTPDELQTSRPPFARPFDHGECTRQLTEPDFYARKYHHAGLNITFQAGDKKPNSGRAFVKCPAFAICWNKQLVEAGFDPSKVIKDTKLGVDHGGSDSELVIENISVF